MNIQNSKYHKIWKITEINGFKKVGLGDSKKNKDGTYTTFTWINCLIAGKARNIEIEENDIIEIVKGNISKRKYDGKYYDDVVIFDLKVMKNKKIKRREKENEKTN